MSGDIEPTDYMNANGLVRGKIPEGQPCPFIDVCKLRVAQCPSKDNLKTTAYSCAAARLHSCGKVGPLGPVAKLFLNGE